MSGNETYTWTDNPMEAGGVCDTDVSNECLMHMKYTHTQSMDVTYDSTTKSLYIGSIQEKVTNKPDGNCINQLQMLNGDVLPVGGANFDGQWVDDLNTIVTNGTLSGDTVTTYSLENYLPDDGHNYEVIFYGSSDSNGSNGNTCQLVFYPGTVNKDTASHGWRFNRAQARTGASVNAGSEAIIPIYANDKNITVYTQDATTNNKSVQIFALKYRRLGNND